MFLKILIGLVALIVVFLALVAMQPAAFRVARSATIAAPPGAVFAQVNDYRKWIAWSPFEKIDPAMQRSFDGPASGVGAGYRWSGNSQAGEGHATIIESRLGELVRIKLDFVRPFAGTNEAAFTFAPEGSQTVVTWSMTGKNNFIGKAFSLVMNCDRMLGREFEKGLADLKSIAESAPRS
jgi:hypothetical protein